MGLGNGKCKMGIGGRALEIEAGALSYGLLNRSTAVRADRAA